MKYQAEFTEEKAFSPVTISLVCETQSELDFWTRFFGYRPISENIPNGDTQNVYSDLEAMGGDREGTATAMEDFIRRIANK